MDPQSGALYAVSKSTEKAEKAERAEKKERPTKKFEKAAEKVEVQPHADTSQIPPA